MNRFAKHISFLIVIVLVISMVMGCSGTPTSQTNNNQTETTKPVDNQTTQTNPYEKPIRFTFLNPWSDIITSSDMVTDPNSQYYDKRWQMILEKYNIAIDYVMSDFGSIAEKTRVSIAAGDIQDVAMTFNLDTKELRKYAQEGGIKSLPEDTYDKYPNIKRAIESVTSKESLMVDGQYVALPRTMDLDGVSGDYINMLLYRKDIAKEAGVTIKDEYTIQEIYDMFKAVKTKFPEMQTFSHIWPNQMYQLGLFQNSPYVGYWPGEGLFFNKKTGKYDYAWALPETLDGIKWLKKFYDDGFMIKDYVNLQNYDARAQFVTGQTFCHFDGANIAFFNMVTNEFKKNNPDKNVEDCVDTFLLVTDEKEYIINDWGNRSGEFVFSPNLDEEKFSRILSLMDYMLSDEGIDLTFFGVEGEHYKKDGDKLVSLRKVVDQSTGALEPLGGADIVPTIMQVIVPEVGIAARNPYINDYVKDRINFLFQKRTNGKNITKSYDNKRATYSSDIQLNFKLDAGGELNKLIITENAANIEDAWIEWLKSNETAYKAAVDDLNNNLLG